MTMNEHLKTPPLRFVQIGDLRLTEAGLQNHLDFRAIVDELNRNVGGKIDFVYLPGDNADDGTPEQFRLVGDALSRLDPPWHVILDHHDFKPGSLDNFYEGLGIQKLPYATNAGGCRCIFLDVVSRGKGGPDFRLGAARPLWLRSQLETAPNKAKPCVIFMRAYPADLGEEAQELSALKEESGAALVAMGHTHYNEIANDRRTIYAATRSTGQIEEGPVGFAFAAIDAGMVSWRFKPLASPWPVVMITSPADRRPAIAPTTSSDPTEIKASAWVRSGSQARNTESTARTGVRCMAATAACSRHLMRQRTATSISKSAHELSLGRIAGAALMVADVALVSRF
jgi:Icc protein